MLLAVSHSQLNVQVVTVAEKCLSTTNGRDE